jgi:uncharacterized protein YciI
MLRSKVHRLKLLHRSFCSSRRCSAEFLITAYDFTDKDALSRRAATRPSHLQGIDTLKISGHFIFGGAILSEETGKPVGSCVLLEAEDIDKAREIVAQDPYIKGNVWDRVTVTPFKTAVMAAENLKK